MASSSFSDAPISDSLDPESKSVTIVINDNGEINYDEKTLQSIIGKLQCPPQLFAIFYSISNVLSSRGQTEAAEYLTKSLLCLTSDAIS